MRVTTNQTTKKQELKNPSEKQYRYLKYLLEHQKMKTKYGYTSGSGICFTNHETLRKILGYSDWRTVKYLEQKMINLGLIIIENLPDKFRPNKQYQKVTILHPKIVRRIVEEYEARNASKSEVESVEPIVSNSALLHNNLININQINQNDLVTTEEEEKKKKLNTTAQDIIAFYNEKSGTFLALSPKLAQYINAAIIRVFESIQKMQEYIEQMIFGKIRKPLEFLKHILRFEVIKANLHKCKFWQKKKAKEEEARLLEEEKENVRKAEEHIRSLERIEAPEVIEFRKKFVRNEFYGAKMYIDYLTDVQLSVRKYKHSEELIILHNQNYSDFMKDYIEKLINPAFSYLQR